MDDEVCFLLVVDALITSQICSKLNINFFSDCFLLPVYSLIT